MEDGCQEDGGEGWVERRWRTDGKERKEEVVVDGWNVEEGEG